MLKLDPQEISKLPHSQLLRVREDVDEAIKVAKAREIQELRVKFSTEAKKRGFDSVDFLHMKSGPKGKYWGKHGSKMTPKYANPEDKSQTWTGQGRKPNWLVAKLDKGAKIDEFRL